MPPFGAKRHIREAIFSGIMYPDDPAELADLIDGLLSAARSSAAEGPEPNQPDDRPLAAIIVESMSARNRTPKPASGILAPHAALQFSGPVQAVSWAAAAGANIDRIVMLAPYRVKGPPAAFLPEAGAFQTPLGEVEVDSTLCEELETYCTLFSTADTPHLEDHSVEVQLPFARRLFPGASIVPILISGDAAVSACMARSIELALDGQLSRTLLVVSTNLASSVIAGDARTRSSQVVDLILAGDWKAVAMRRDINGAAAIAAAMATERLKAAKGRLLSRIDSRRRESLPDARVVEYASFAWFGDGL